MVKCCNLASNTQLIRNTAHQVVKVSTLYLFNDSMQAWKTLTIFLARRKRFFIFDLST